MQCEVLDTQWSEKSFYIDSISGLRIIFYMDTLSGVKEVF